MVDLADAQERSRADGGTAMNAVFEMQTDRNVREKLDGIDRELRSDIRKTVEMDRVRERRTQEISRRHLLVRGAEV